MRTHAATCLFLGSLLALGPGCISYGLQGMPRAGALPAPPPPDQRASVSYTVRMVPGTELTDSSGEFPELSQGRLDQEFPAALARCGWFRTVQEARDDVRGDVHWLPLLRGMSFAPWGDACADVRENLYETLLDRLHADGFLQPPAAAR